VVLGVARNTELRVVLRGVLRVVLVGVALQLALRVRLDALEKIAWRKSF
jgi:hypothetical protein